jgi:hypothetical protein
MATTNNDRGTKRSADVANKSTEAEVSLIAFKEKSQFILSRSALASAIAGCHCEADCDVVKSFSSC